MRARQNVPGKVGVMSGWWRRSLILTLVLAVSLAGGCKKKGPKPGEDGSGAGGFGEESIGSGSSLERSKRGLSPEEDGILADVHFAYDSADVDATARDALTRNVGWLRENSRAKIELEGHADSRGTIEYNLALGAKRAKAVKDYLSAQGIAADRISTISYGKELPLCREENEACWARNRRVHSVILGQ
jgi:peptidoglycan-associated lipoprotein